MELITKIGIGVSIPTKDSPTCRCDVLIYDEQKIE